jgi:hypothetical protein
LHAIRTQPVAERSHMAADQQLHSPHIGRRRPPAPVVCSPLAPRSRDLQLLVAEGSNQLQRPAQRGNEAVQHVRAPAHPRLDLPDARQTRPSARPPAPASSPPPAHLRQPPAPRIIQHRRNRGSERLRSPSRLHSALQIRRLPPPRSPAHLLLPLRQVILIQLLRPRDRRPVPTTHCPDSSPATSSTADRHGSNTSKIRTSLRPPDGGRSSFILATREAVTASSSGLPSAGPLRSSTRIA